MSENTVICTLEPAKSGQVGVIQLNSEKTLNSLTLAMVERIYDALVKWQSDANVACVFLHAAGEKAFCAGGDVQQLYHSATSQPGGPCEYAETFFAKEYRLNYLIHTYGKPIICWGNGIVMGGGLGLLAGASHRIGTPTTRIAMPEITIALFPDVGGSWILNRLSHKLGYFLALTGAPLNLVDALECGELDYAMVDHDWDHVMNLLSVQSWSTEPNGQEANHKQLTDLISELSTSLENLETKGDIPSQTAPFRDKIEKIFESEDLVSVIDEINKLEGDSKWLTTAKRTLNDGSPLSASLMFEQLLRSRDYTLAEVFQSELMLATNIVRFPEFAEGVRALLIDKDRNPNWTYKSIGDIPTETKESFFKAPWETNPLADL